VKFISYRKKSVKSHSQIMKDLNKKPVISLIIKIIIIIIIIIIIANKEKIMHAAYNIMNQLTGQLLTSYTY
jgi:hypothetical protein